MNEFSYGSFASEEHGNKYFDILIERDGKVVKTGAVVYPHSVHLSDVSVHTFCEKEYGEKCTFSPTGFCGCYDEIRWDSIGTYISPKLVAEILIERLNRLRNFKLTSQELREIRDSLYNELTLEEEE